LLDRAVIEVLEIPERQRHAVQLRQLREGRPDLAIEVRGLACALDYFVRFKIFR
jgi:hypothetical protein